MIVSDCAVLIHEELEKGFRTGTPVVIRCPLLEDPYKLFDKIKLIINETSAKSIDVYTVKVPLLPCDTHDS